MKYLKKYENNHIRKKWIISLKKPNLEISLEKLLLIYKDYSNYGADSKQIRKDAREQGISRRAIINLDIYQGDACFWKVTKWNQSEYEDMGEIIITPEEIEEWKIKQSAKKFNI